MEILVRPHASKVGVGGSHDGALVVRVAEPADGGRATRAALRALSEALGVPPRSVTLLRGPASRRKVVEIDSKEQEGLLESRLQHLSRVTADPPSKI